MRRRVCVGAGWNDIFTAAPAGAQGIRPPARRRPNSPGLEHAPEHIRDRVARKLPIKIVAIGSSSTSGAGASSQAATYPSRLEAELKARLPGLPITVLNKGIGGEEAPQMVARFDADVIEEAPDLVLWQVGSNSVLRDHPTPGEVIRQGVERLKASGTEVILLNPQYAPKILAKPDFDHAVDVITATARDAEVGLFNRFGGDAHLGRGREDELRSVPLARRPAHERLELRLHRQAAGGRHPG